MHKGPCTNYKLDPLLVGTLQNKCWRMQGMQHAGGGAGRACLKPMRSRMPQATFMLIRLSSAISTLIRPARAAPLSMLAARRAASAVWATRLGSACFSCPPEDTLQQGFGGARQAMRSMQL